MAADQQERRLMSLIKTEKSLAAATRSNFRTLQDHAIFDGCGFNHRIYQIRLDYGL